MRGQRVAIVPQLLDSGAKHCGHGQEKAEFGGGAPVFPHRQRAHDRGARSRNPRNHGQALHQPDGKGAPRWQRADRFVIARAGHPFDRDDRDAADDQRHRDHGGRFEQHIDALFQQHPQHGRGNERDQHIADEMQRIGFAPEGAGRNPGERAPVHHHDRQDRGQLDHDVEHLPVLQVIAEEIGGQDQVSGGGHGQELGQSLDDAKHDGGEIGIHGRMGLPQRSTLSSEARRRCPLNS